MKEEPKKLSVLEQRPLPWRRQKLTLFEDRFELEVRGALDRYKIPFYLHNVKEKPDRVILVPWLWLLFSAAALVASSYLWVTAHGGPERILAGGLDLLGMATLAVQCLKMRPRLVFSYKSSAPDRPHTRYEPHLYVAPDQPTSEAVKQFLELARVTQKRHVEKMKAEQEGDAGIGYAREVERFAELRARDALSEEEFDRVKAKLLNLKPRRMGFR